MKGQFGDKIRKVREIRGFSQEFMSEKLNLSQRAYSKIEREEIKLDWQRINEIAAILELDPIDLVTFDDSLIFHNCSQSGKFIESTLNYNFPAELKEQYEKRIGQLESEVAFLREQLSRG